MADRKNVVTPKAAEGHAQTYEGDAAAMPQVRGAKSSTKESDGLPSTSTKLDEKDLEKFLDVNLDTQARRDWKRKVSKWKLMISLFLTVLLETMICLGFYVFFIYCKPRRGGGSSVHNSYDINGTKVDDGSGNGKAGWPSLAGVSTVLTIIGAALTFLLVFSLSWTFQRWRSARALMDETVTTLRELYIFVSTQNQKKITPEEKEELMKTKKGQEKLKKLVEEQNYSLPEEQKKQEKLLKSFRMSLLWYGAMLVIYMDVAKVTDWTTSNDGLMDTIGERVANWWLRSSLYDWFMQKLYIKDPDYNSQAALRKKEPRPVDNEAYDMRLDVFKDSAATSKTVGRRVVIPGGGYGTIERITDDDKCVVARDDTGHDLEVTVPIDKLELDLINVRVVIPTEKGGGYGTIESITDKDMCVVVRYDEGGVDAKGEALPSRLEVPLDDLKHAPREKILPYFKAEVLKAQVKIRKQLIKLETIKYKVEPMVIACNMYSNLVNNFYAMNKFKTYQMPHLIKWYLLPALTYAYTFIIFPVLLPYTFVMNLDSRAVRNELLLTNKWSTAVFLTIFAVSTSLILFYFNLLYAIQKELEDPFGDDFSDLKLRKRFLTPLIKDFKTYADALKEKGSNSDRAMLLALETEASLVNVDDSAEGDGETEDQK